MCKTFPIPKMVELANKYFASEHSTSTRDGRKALASFVETILHETNNYNGFNYLRANDLARGIEPGIIFDETEARAHTFPDDSRIFFYRPKCQ